MLQRSWASNRNHYSITWAQDSDSLNAIAKEVQNARIRAENRVQKTYVISRQSLVLLDQISRAFNAPRDALVELSVRRLLPVIDNEQKKI